MEKIMIDRALGIGGIALTILAAVFQLYLPFLPTWAPLTGLGIGLFLVGLSVGLYLAGTSKRKRKVRQSAFLRLHIFGDHRTPQLVTQDNIFRWYYLQYKIDAIGPESRRSIGLLATLFVTFEEDVAIHTLNVTSPDMILPIYEVKEFNQRYAIITFSDAIPAGTLEIRASL